MRAARIVTVAVVAAFVLSGCVLSETGDARIVANESALFTGTVRNSDEGAATYWFEYGSTPDRGSSTPKAQVAARGSAQVSQFVDGLTAGTTYHYRLCSDQPDTIPPQCGADKTVTTSTARDSLHGDGAYTYTQPPLPDIYGGEVSVMAADGPAEGDVAFSGSSPGTPLHGPVYYAGNGSVSCLRVSGNIAVVGYSYRDSDSGQTFGGGLVVEDNGATGDRWSGISWSPGTACPAPSASLFDAGTPRDGNFVVHDA